MSPYQYEGDDTKHDLILKTKQPTACTCTSPHCQSCLLAHNQHCYPTGTHRHRDPKSKGVLKLGDVKRGITFFTNQYELRHCGCLSHKQRKELDSSKFCACIIITNPASSFLFHQNQVSLNANDTLNTKSAFKHFADNFNICIKHYCCDNSIFKSTAYITDCMLKSQCQSFCGIDTHHQN
eukprot:8696876-Ditylum_brightwellii.AAC.1